MNATQKNQQTGRTWAYDRLAVPARYGLMGLAVGLCLSLAAGTQAAVYTDNFNRPDESLAAGPDWGRRGDKNEHLVTGNLIAAETAGAGTPIGNWYDGALHVAENYQRAAIEFKIDSGFPDYGGFFDIALNQDWPNSGYYLQDNSYRLVVRGRNDFAVFKNVGGVDVISTFEGTDPFINFTISTLAYDAWYKATIIRSNDVIIGSITSLDGLTVYGTGNITDTGSLLNGGKVGLATVIAGFNTTETLYRFDNFEYELFSIVPEPSSVALLGLGGLLILRQRKKME